MAKTKLKISIPSDISLEVEKRHFEYTSALNVVAFFDAAGKINHEVLQDYITTVEYRGVKLDQLKVEINKKYVPEEYAEEPYIYDFDENCLVFNGVDIDA